MNHFMLDLETLGSGTNGAIVTIGCVAFDPHQGVIDANGFYARVAFDSPHFGLIDASNVAFWFDQVKEAQEEAMSQKLERWPLKACLTMLDDWLIMKGAVGITPFDIIFNDKARLWAKPPEYDVRLLRDAYARVDQRFPFHWRATRDMRTLLEVGQLLNMDGATPMVGTKHNALDDAVHQAQVVCDVYQAFKRRLRS